MTAPLTDARLEEIRAMLAARPEYFNPGTHDLLAELDRLKARRCETCRYQTHHIDPAYIIPPICGNLSIPGHSVANVTCASLGNGCNAWEAK